MIVQCCGGCGERNLLYVVEMCAVTDTDTTGNAKDIPQNSSNPAVWTGQLHAHRVHQSQDMEAT